MIENVYRNGYEFQIDHERPFLRFKGGSKPKIPPTPAPTPTPVGVDEEEKRKSQARRRQRIFAGGRGGTVLTEGQDLGTARVARATLLGASTASE